MARFNELSWPDRKFLRKREGFLKDLCICTRADGSNSSRYCDSFPVSEQNDIFCASSQDFSVSDGICPILGPKCIEDSNRTLVVFVSIFWKTFSDICLYIRHLQAKFVDKCSNVEHFSEGFGSPRIYPVDRTKEQGKSIYIRKDVIKRGWVLRIKVHDSLW